MYVANYGAEGDPNCNFSSTDSVASLNTATNTSATLRIFRLASHPVAMVETPDAIESLCAEPGQQFGHGSFAERLVNSGDDPGGQHAGLGGVASGQPARVCRHPGRRAALYDRHGYEQRDSRISAGGGRRRRQLRALRQKPEPAVCDQSHCRGGLCFRCDHRSADARRQLAAVASAISIPRRRRVPAATCSAVMPVVCGGLAGWHALLRGQLCHAATGSTCPDPNICRRRMRDSASDRVRCRHSCGENHDISAAASR